MDGILTIVGNVIIIIGLGFMGFGIIALFRFKTFYARLLASAKIDTVGAITIIIGMSIRHGFSAFTAKILLMAAIMFVFTPLVAHILARSAYLSGHQLDNPDLDCCEVKKL